jgi:hypothetical protein
VVGAAIGVVLPSKSHDDGAIGFWVAVAIVGLTAAVVALRLRALGSDGRSHLGTRAGATATTQLPARLPASGPPPPRSDGNTVDVRKTRPY